MYVALNYHGVDYEVDYLIYINLLIHFIMNVALNHHGVDYEVNYFNL